MRPPFACLAYVYQALGRAAGLLTRGIDADRVGVLASK
jgi:hypothetical protein